MKTRRIRNSYRTTFIRIVAIFAAIAGLALIAFIMPGKAKPISNLTEPGGKAVWWNIQSVDTMKYSRDLAREKIDDPSFDTVIDAQTSLIAQTGATHIGIATPYDERFIPILTRWVSSARAHNLKVWFRGNFSGWEGWFETPRISRDEHIELLDRFIGEHGDLFEDGDIFTPCPECENGGPGDPRSTGDTRGHRQFLIDEYRVSNDAFRDLGINVRVGYFSMNYDVARLIMDRKTTEQLGGIVTIDHYVRTPEQLLTDVRSIAKQSGGSVYLGEFGVPIPDINGPMTERQQYQWVNDALTLLQEEPSVVGINYWVGTGGSTQVWDGEGRPREAVSALTRAFTPTVAYGIVRDQFGKPVKNVRVDSAYRTSRSGSDGTFRIPVLSREQSLEFTRDGSPSVTVSIEQLMSKPIVILPKRNLSLWERIKSIFVQAQ